jgi:hypothetical protein
LAKIDSDGGLVWQKTYSGGKSDLGYSVYQTSDGGLVVAGYTTSYGDAYSAIWVLRLDSQGSIIWQKAYGGGGMNTFDEAYSVAQLPDGGFVVGGFGSGLASGPGLPPSVAPVLRLDSAGNVVWSRGYGHGQFWQALASLDGGVLLVGSSGIAIGSNGMAMVVKLDTNTLIGPGCNLESLFNDTTVDSTAVPVEAPLTSFNTQAQAYPVSAVVKDTSATVSVPCSRFEMTVAVSAGALTVQALAKVAIHVHASSDNTPVTGANVTLDRNVPGNFSETTGLTDSTGYFTVLYGAPNVSKATTIPINVTISKQGYWTSQKLIQLTLNPLQRGPPNPTSPMMWLYFIVGGIILGSILGLTAVYVVRGRKAKATKTL